MFINSILNIFTTVYTAVICIVNKIPGWRYPMTNYLDRGTDMPSTADIAELIFFNTLKHSRIMRCWGKLPFPCVVLVTYHDGSLRANLYRLIKDTGQSDLAIATNGQQGIDGLFYYLVDSGNLRHARRPTSMTRERGFIANEPIMSYILPLLPGQRLEIHDLLELEHLQDTNHHWEPCHVAHAD